MKGYIVAGLVAVVAMAIVFRVEALRDIVIPKAK